MTEQEAIELLKRRKVLSWQGGFGNYDEAEQMAIKALEEISLYKQVELCLIPADVYKKQCEELEQYRALGTVDGLRVARDKQIPKMPKIWANGTKHCPNEDCEEVIYTSDNYCLKCGQKLDWSDEDDI